jgi:hypothetical protein
MDVGLASILQCEESDGTCDEMGRELAPLAEEVWPEETLKYKYSLDMYVPFADHLVASFESFPFADQRTCLPTLVPRLSAMGTPVGLLFSCISTRVLALLFFQPNSFPSFSLPILGSSRFRRLMASGSMVFKSTIFPEVRLVSLHLLRLSVCPSNGRVPPC